jgi:hypothetical protein
MVPQHCIDKFEKRFNSYPSLINIELEKKEMIDKFLSKSIDLWSSSIVIEKEIINVERLVEYDPAGVFIYIIFSNKINLTFLTTLDRHGVTEYSVKQLIKN